MARRGTNIALPDTRRTSSEQSSCDSWGFIRDSSPAATVEGARWPLQTACTIQRNGRRVRLANLLAVADVAIVELVVLAFSGVTLALR